MTKVDQCNATECTWFEDNHCAREKVNINEDGKCAYHKVKPKTVTESLWRET